MCTARMPVISSTSTSPITVNGAVRAMYIAHPVPINGAVRAFNVWSCQGRIDGLSSIIRISSTFRFSVPFVRYIRTYICTYIMYIFRENSWCTNFYTFLLFFLHINKRRNLYSNYLCTYYMYIYNYILLLHIPKK